MSIRSPTVLFLLLLVVTAGLAGCRTNEQAPTPKAADGPADRLIHVASNGWHTAIIVHRDAVPARVVPEVQDFPGAAFVEFGWGDREYYPNPRPSLGDALAAGLVPGDSVIHLAGLQAPPRDGGNIEVLTLHVTGPSLDELVAAIGADFDRGGAERAAPVSRGLVPDSHFYAAHGTFHLFNTCNTWVAEKLAATGLGIATTGVITADDLMARLRPLVSEKASSPYPP